MSEAGAALLLLYVLRRAWQKSRAAALARRELGPHARVFPAAFSGARWLAVAPREADEAIAATKRATGGGRPSARLGAGRRSKDRYVEEPDRAPRTGSNRIARLP